ncbi:MAG TPA: carbohydrate ABC transporter permease [Gemmatimonadales bacterium]|nr:carbohydrate ABC transporter permease [Gemmatimonadales bacterium]
MNRRVAPLLLHGVLLLGAVATLLPLVWMVSASLMPTGDATTYPPRFFPRRVTFEHYAELFTRLSLGRYLLNSTLVTVSATLLSLLFNSMAGYALAKLRFRGRERVFRLLVVGLVIPSQVTMLPLFLLLRAMGLVNTYFGAIVPLMATIFCIFLVRQYALSIPDDLLDAARLDGASELRIYWSVALPAMRPILATLAIFTFLSTWNDFLWPLVVLSDDAKYTLPVALANLVGEHVQDTELMMAGSVLTVLPVLVLFVLLQRHYIEGIMAGSAKG